MNLGPYRLISRLGAGGMGEVWRAEDTRLLRPAAIKILPEQLARDPEWKVRFLREARTIAQLNHPNIATIYAIEQEGDTFFIAMELVEGEALSAMIARGPLPAHEVTRIARASADALGEAHAKGIVHRDVKPDNIIVSPRTVKVLDFGIAKQIGRADEATLTQNGMIIGTPHYMSPEQALGRPVDARTDLFSLGVVLYEALSGQRPFTGDVVTEALMKIVLNEPEDIASIAPNTPAALAEVVRRCLKKQPGDRFQTAGELRAALDGPPLVARKEDTPTVEVKTPAPFRPEPERVKPPATPRGRALIADDDPATRYLLAQILTRHHFTFDEAANGADAVKFLKAHEYALVFVDLLMPRVDGWGVIDYIRSKHREHPPRLFVVTGVQNQKLSTADQDVVAGLLYKPLDLQQVESVVTAS
ncbi:MAG TPA: protein kinase [Thermoanaerobaculia bacterium]